MSPFVADTVRHLRCEWQCVKFKARILCHVLIKFPSKRLCSDTKVMQQKTESQSLSNTQDTTHDV